MATALVRTDILGTGVLVVTGECVFAFALGAKPGSGVCARRVSQAFGGFVGERLKAFPVDTRIERTF